MEPTGAGFGAVVRGVDLARPIEPELAAQLRAAWLHHLLLVFPDQDLGPAQLEQAATAFGPIGEDPYFRPMAGQPHVVALTREADEQTPIFADVLHSDWSFLPTPPAGTMLYAVDVPPVGGDTIFANQHAALDLLPEQLRARVEGLRGVHSARRGYAPDGQYGQRDAGRSMAIVSSEAAYATQTHPLVRTHPETGRPALFVSVAYTIGIEGLDDLDAAALIGELYPYTCDPAVVHRHRWEPGMVALWDNRSLLHAATGGYDGHRRELHRLTIADRQAG